MRLPVVPQISTKNGTSNKNARLTNCLKESKKSGDKAVIRPGLVLDAQASGVGNGLVVFNNELVSVYGATLGFGVEPATEFTTGLKNISDQLLSIIEFGGEYLCHSGDMLYRTADFVTFTPLVASSIYEIGNAATNGTTAHCYFYNLDTDDEGFLSVNTSFVASEAAVLGWGNERIIYGGGKYLVNKTTTKSATSTDGISWTEGTATTALTDVAYAYGNGVYVRTGLNFPGSTGLYAQTSSDGLLWSSAVLIKLAPVTNGTYSSTRRFVFANGVFMYGGLDLVAYSSDGATWTVIFPFPYDFACWGIDYSSGLDTWIAVGDYSYYSNIHTKMSSTDNGVTWTDFGETEYNGIQYNGVLGYSGAITFGSTIVSGAANNIEVISAGAAASIPALATITGDRYDFAQSPI